MHPTDAMAFAAILDHQAARGWSGALAEIGVFYGRSLALMALDAKSRGDKALALDLFDIPGQQAYVEDVLARHGLAEAVTFRPGSSLELAAADVLNEVGPVRLFSVDGGHELVHIANDAELATATLTAEGVVAFDDFMNAQYPDLSLGIIRFLEANADRLVPFAITRAKLYACPPAVYDDYRAAMAKATTWAGAKLDGFPFMGRDMAFIDQPLASRAIYQKFAERGLGKLGERLTPNRGRRFARQ
jgi:hypothetical protein